MALPFGFTSCGDDEPENPDNPGTAGGGSGTTTEPVNEALSADAAKKRLETTANDFMGKMSASDFQYLVDLANYVRDHYADEDTYGTSPLTDYFEDCFNALATTKTGSHEGDWDTKYTDYKRIWRLSNFTGHFTAGEKEWKHTEANDLQFQFTDHQGKQCTVTVKGEGNTKQLLLWEDEENWDYEYISGNDYYTADWYKNYVLVPEKVTVELKQESTTKALATVTTDLSSIKTDEANLASDAASVTATVKAENYEWYVTRAAYSAPDGKASVAGGMKKDGQTLFTMSLTAQDVKATNDSWNKTGKTDVSVDILGAMQVKGSCSDLKALSDYLDEAAGTENESTMKSYISKANALLDLGLYFGGGSYKQATVELRCFKDEYDWGYEPVIVFSDGSSYSFENYFNETDFKTVIDTFNRLIDDFEGLAD